MDERHCAGKRRDGSACQAKPLPGRDRCWAHDSLTADKRQRAYVSGGQAKARVVRAAKILPIQLRPLLSAWVAALKDTRDGALDPRRASAMAMLAGAIVRLYQFVEVEQRLEAIEAELRRSADIS